MRNWSLDELRGAQADLEALVTRLRLTTPRVSFNMLADEMESVMMRQQGYLRNDRGVEAGDAKDRFGALVTLLENLIQELLKAQELETR